MNTALITFGYPHLAISLGSDYLLSKGKNAICVYILERSENALETLAEFLKARHIDILGLSVSSTYFKEAIKLSSFIRRHLKAKIIFGGCHPTLCPEECISHCDVVCIGPGEDTLLDLIVALEKNSTLESVKGIWYVSEDRIIKNPPRAPGENIDLFFENIDFDRRQEFFLIDSQIRTQERFSIEGYATIAGKGCSFNCAYCNTPVYHRALGVKGFRKRSVDNVIEELIKAKKFFPDLKHIRFLSSVFPYTGRELDDFSEKYVTHINLPFSVFHHINLLAEGDLIKLKKAGLYGIYVGLQNGSERFRGQVYNRFQTNKSCLEFTREAVSARIPLIVVDIILAPETETIEDLKESIEFLAQLPKRAKLRIFQMNYFPKTALSDKLMTQGKIGIDRLAQYSSRPFDEWHPDFRFLTYSQDEKNYYYWLILLISRAKIPIFACHFFLRNRNVLSFKLIQSLLLTAAFGIEIKKLFKIIKQCTKRPSQKSLAKLARMMRGMFGSRNYLLYFEYPNDPFWWPPEPIYCLSVKSHS